MRKAVTIKDMAMKLRVSHTTVSRAIRNDKRISKATRARVQAAAKQLGYVPNRAGTALVTGRSLSILLVVPYQFSFFPRRFHMEVFEGLVEELSAHGYSVQLVLDSYLRRRGLSPLNVFEASRADGGVLLSVRSRDAKMGAHAFPVPLVVVNQVIPGLEADFVLSDERKGAYTATAHLIDQGHRRIAHITGSRAYYIAIARRQGYEDALKAHGIPLDEQLIVTSRLTPGGGYAAVQQLRKAGEHFTALFCCIDLLALGAMQALQDAGLRIPQDVAVVGYDDDVFAAVLKPSLSSVRKSRYAIGRVTGRILMQRLRGEVAPGRRIQRHVNTRLIVRESSVREAAPAELTTIASGAGLG